MSDVICPQCKDTVPLDPPYWLWRGEWFCSEICVRKMSPKREMNMIEYAEYQRRGY